MRDGNAHAGKLFVQLAPGHRGVLIAFEVREDTWADVGGERPGCYEKTALHHELGLPDAAQKSGFATAIGTGHDDQGLYIGVEVISNGVAF